VDAARALEPLPRAAVGASRRALFRCAHRRAPPQQPGAVHGGALGPVADTMLGYALTYGTDRSVVLITAHLSIDLLGGIGPGQ
jgi:acyl-coenzyme A thioesterase PaaI-like protein